MTKTKSVHLCYYWATIYALSVISLFKNVFVGNTEYTTTVHSVPYHKSINIEYSAITGVEWRVS